LKFGEFFALAIKLGLDLLAIGGKRLNLLFEFIPIAGNFF
jgi:hypothetical protein